MEKVEFARNNFSTLLINVERMTGNSAFSMMDIKENYIRRHVIDDQVFLEVQT